MADKFKPNARAAAMAAMVEMRTGKKRKKSTRGKANTAGGAIADRTRKMNQRLREVES